MIGAVVDPRGEPFIRERLTKLADATGEGAKAQITIVGNVGLVAGTKIPAGEIRENKCSRYAVEGALRGELARPDFFSADSLSGDFCLLAVDKEEGRKSQLLAVRGRFGGRPLYYVIEDGVLVVCSRLEAIVRSSPRGLKINRDRLPAGIASTSPDDLAATYYRDVSRVLTGESVLLNAAGVVARAKLSFVTDGTTSDSPERIVERLRAEFLDAVKRSTEGADYVGVMAGGGVDSSGLLAALALHRQTMKKPAFDVVTLDFSGRGDDRPYLAELSRAFQIEPLRVRPKDCGALVRESFVLDASPATAPQFPWDLAMSKLAKSRGADRLLMGSGGDELFDGDFRALAAPALRGDVAKALHDVLSLQSQYEGGSIARVRDFLVKPVLKRALPKRVVALRRRLNRRKAIRHIAWAGPVLREFMSRPHNDGVYPDDDLELSTKARLELLAYAPFLMESADGDAQVENTVGCVRVEPYLDESFVRFVATIPPDYFFYGHRVRGLLRAAFAGLVPDRVRFRPDKARFEVALIEQFEGMGGCEAIRDLLSMEALGDLGLLDPRKFRHSFEAFAKSRDLMLQSRDWFTLWAPLALESFLRTTPARIG